VSWILVTNDDGVNAPGLPSLIRAVGGIAPVRAVVPDREKSWVGKAISRFDPVRVSMVERGGLEIHAVTGYPADCVQLGVNTLFDGPPRLVVSGINIGYNHGSAYLQASGTVGAVLEAAIAGVDGVAFSAGSGRPWGEWRSWAESADSVPMWERLADVAAAVVAPLYELDSFGATLSVNLPDTADATTPRRATSVAQVGYDRLFEEREPGVYVHAYGGGMQHRASLRGTDVEAAADGVVSIAAVAGATTGDLPTAARAALAI
jgi:5'-nucleotidase